MVIEFALLGALALGLLIGLTYRGFVMFGDRRRLDVMVEQLQTEHRISQRTNQAIAAMRQAIRDQLRIDRPA